MIKAAALAGARPFELPGKAAYLLALSFSSVLEAGALELEGWLLVLGEVEEPAPAELELLLGLVDAPPPALFFSSVLVAAEPEAAPEGEVDDGAELDEEEAAPEGEDGVVEGDVVEPDEDAAPDGGVLVSRAVRPLLLSPQAARPKARETAAARMESFMCSPPGWGKGGAASFGPAAGQCPRRGAPPSTSKR